MFKNLLRSEGGAMAPLAVATLPIMLGFGAISAEVVGAHVRQARLQQTSDAIALSAGLAYRNANKNPNVIEPTARAVALANGIDPSRMRVEFLSGYTGPSGDAIRVTLTDDVPIMLGRAVTNLGSLEVSSVSTAGLAMPKAAPCIIALGTVGINTSGAGQLRGNGCAINTNGNITAVGSAQVVAASIDLSGFTSVSGAGQIYSAPGPRTRVYADLINAAKDPLAGDPRIASALIKIGQHSRDPVVPTDPDTPVGTDWDLRSWWASGVPGGLPAGVTQPAGGVYEIAAGGTYNIRSLKTGGGITVRFKGPSTVNISAGIDHAGEIIDFAGGVIKINGIIETHGYAPIKFGDADVHIGSGPVLFSSNRDIKTSFGNGNVTVNTEFKVNPGSDITIGNGRHVFRGLNVGYGGTLIVGDGNIDIAQGIRLPDGGQVKVGKGDYTFGPNPSTGNAILLNGGAGLFLDAGPSLFTAIGHVIEADGGSHLTFPESENHEITGDLFMAGGVMLRPARYTIGGSIRNVTGGTQWPTTQFGITYGAAAPYAGHDIAGQDITLVAGGTITLAGGAQANLIARKTPESSVDGAIQGILFITPTTQDTVVTEGGGIIVSGALYTPNSKLRIEQGATLSSGTDTTNCLMLIVQSIDVTGGAAGGTTCPSVAPLLGDFEVALIK